MFLFQLDSGGCFPSMAKVKIENGNWIEISELQPRDHVQTGIILQLNLENL